MTGNYISREALGDVLADFWIQKFSPCIDFLNSVCDIQSADVQPVVLCRDCVHYEMGVCLKIYDDGNVSKDAWQERKPDDFCSYGEDRNVPTNCGADMREES